MKKIFSFVLAFLMLLNINILPIKAKGEENTLVKWDDRVSEYKEHDMEWKFRPDDNLISCQNPPDFSWPWVNFATSYELIVCKDKELKNIAYEKRGLTNNYYNFNHTFEPGEYYWSVRFNSAKGKSEWSKPQRFLLLPDAKPFLVDEYEDLIKKIPQSHPKTYITKDNIDKYRETCKDIAKGPYNIIKNAAYKHMSEPIIKEPIYDPSNPNALRGASSGAANLLMRCGFTYQIEQDKKLGEFAVKSLMELCSWDPKGNTAYEHQDQAFREFLWAATIGYDYLYDLLTPSQREIVLNNIKERGKILAHPEAGLSDSPDKLPRSPFMSHGWSAMGYILTTAVTVYGEIPEAAEWIKKFLMLYLNCNAPWAGEDGAWAQGTGYCKVSILDFDELKELLINNNIVNIHDKAMYQNFWKYALYTMGTKTGAEYGDQSYGVFDGDWALITRFWGYQFNNPYAMWQHEKNGVSPVGAINLISMLTKEKPTPKPPIDLPNSIVFPHTGLVAMHSSVEDLNGRITCFFKSSPYGSFNHSQPDQNAFIIQAFGERLAIDSGYYDYYNSVFDRYYNKRSFAHNTITFDGGQGQPIHSMVAKGDIKNFLTHPDFDLATGDASGAYDYDCDYEMGYRYYHKKLDKVKRHMIYVRPDTFIVVDDLKAHDDKKVKFEWWLNAFSNISLYESKKGARIVEGKAALDAKVCYPENITAKYSDVFSGPDLVSYTPVGAYTNEQVHKRVWFETEPVNETKMITALTVHKDNTDAPYVKNEKIGNVNKMSFEDGTIAYIKNDYSKEMKIDGFETDAEAFTVKKATVMMVDGTYFKKNGEEIIKSDKICSVVYGNDELGLSSKEDVNIKVKTGNVTKVVTSDKKEIKANDKSRGVKWNSKEEYTDFLLFPGFYTLYLNDKPLPGKETEGPSFKVDINGEVKEIKSKGYFDHSGKKVLSADLFNKSDFFNINEISDINIQNNSKAGDVVLLKPNETIYITGENPKLKLSALSMGAPAKAERIDDFDSIKNKCDIFIEAENYTEKEGAGYPYTSRSFLSNGTGFTDFNTFGSSAKWEFEVKESGYYDLVMKYVGWGNETIDRLYKVNDAIGSVAMPATGNYGQTPNEWIATRNKTKIYLEKGTNTVTIYPKVGNWNFDWLGFIKSDKE